MVILDLSSDHSANDLERRVMNLQVFAKFLGYLVFSPNWHGADINLNLFKPFPPTDGLQQLEFLGLPLEKLVEDAWSSGCAIVVVPWVTEILKMVKWDSFSQSSGKYRQLLTHLRCIQEEVGVYVAEERFKPAMLIITFCLEAFFHETAGFPKLTSLSLKSVRPVADLEFAEPSLDRRVLGFSEVLFFASNPHVEDLASLIMNLSFSLSKSPTKTRKLRPSVVSREVGLDSTRLFNDIQSDGKHEFSSPEKNVTAWSLGIDVTNIRAKLVDAFFHQHRDLKEICELVVDRALKNISHQVTQKCIRPAFLQRKISLKSSGEKFDEAYQSALEQSRNFLKSHLEQCTRDTLKILSPPRTNSKVMDVAASLAIERGIQLGQPIIDALVLSESNTLRDSLGKTTKKIGVSACDVYSVEVDELFQKVISALSNLRELFSGRTWEYKREEISDKIAVVESALDSWALSLDTRIPPESDLRLFFELISRVDETIPDVVDWFLSCDDVDFSSMIVPYLKLACKLSTYSSGGNACLEKVLKNVDVLKRLTKDRSDAANSNSIESLSNMLGGLIEARILERSALLEAKILPDLLEKKIFP